MERLGAQLTSVYPWESAATRTASLKSSVLSRTLAIAEGAAAAAASSGQIHDALEPARYELLWAPSAGERQEEQTVARRIDRGRPPAIQRVGSGGDWRGRSLGDGSGRRRPIHGSAHQTIAQLRTPTVPPTRWSGALGSRGRGGERRRLASGPSLDLSLFA
jgi:hypothetical protein